MILTVVGNLADDANGLLGYAVLSVAAEYEAWAGFLPASI